MALGIHRELHDLSLLLGAALSQVPLSLSALIVMPLVLLVSHATFGVPTFQLGILILGAAAAASLALPWNRLPDPTYWLLPVLDFEAI